MRESRLKNEKENVLPAPQHDVCSYVLTLFLFRLISLSLSRARSLSRSLSLSSTYTDVSSTAWLRPCLTSLSAYPPRSVAG